MAGALDSKEAELLDSIALFGVPRYLRLIEYVGPDPNLAAGLTVSDTGVFPTNTQEVTAGWYSPRLVDNSEWANAVQGAPTEKKVPKLGGTDIGFTPSGGAEHDICGYCWTTNTAAITSANCFWSGVILDPTGVPSVKHIDATHPLIFTDQQPIVERFGDPPIGVDPT